MKQGLTEGIVAFDVKGYKVVDILGKSIKKSTGWELTTLSYIVTDFLGAGSSDENEKVLGIYIYTVGEQKG